VRKKEREGGDAAGTEGRSSLNQDYFENGTRRGRTGRSPVVEPKKERKSLTTTEEEKSVQRAGGDTRPSRPRESKACEEVSMIQQSNGQKAALSASGLEGRERR